MQKNTEIILFTYDYPFGKSEKTFIEYELSQLSKDFDKIEIINQKNSENKIEENYINKNKIEFNNDFAKKISIYNLIEIFFTKVLFEKIFWKELSNILFKKKFLKKLKMCVNEISLSFLLVNYICKIKNKNDKIIFYSFWSNFTLISFIKLKKIYKNAKFISRALGSDLNGYIKNDDFVPYKNVKFSALDKLFLLGEYQKQKLPNINLNNKIEICPLGVFQQKFNEHDKNKIKLIDPIIFISCGNLIEIKNNLLMIDFISKFNELTKRKVEFILIGKGKLKKKIIDKLKNNPKIIYQQYDRVDNFVDFLLDNKVHFFLNFSSQEGMPFTIMEAMSCGIPIIASNIKPNEYLVRDRGYLLKLENYKNSSKILLQEINQDLININRYYFKSENSYKFINNNLINENCYNKFKKILDNIDN